MKYLRNLLAFTLLFGLSIHSYAQDTTNSYTSSPLFSKTGDIGVSILVDGLIDNISLGSVSNDYGQNLLFVKYYLEDDLVLRAGFGLNIDRYRREQADSIGQDLVEQDSTFNRYFINISGGIEKHLKGTKRLDPFIFSQMDLTFIGKSKSVTETRVTTQAGSGSAERTIKTDGGIAFGLQFGGGFNYFVTNRFSLGTELALKLQASSVGGTTSTNLVINPIGGNTSTEFISREDKINQLDVDVQPTALINLSYFF